MQACQSESAGKYGRALHHDQESPNRKNKIKETINFRILVKQGQKRNTRYTYLLPNIQNESEDEDEDL